MSTTPNTQNKTEQLHTAEVLSSRKQDEHAGTRAPLSAARVESVISKRTDALKDIRTGISPDLGRAIQIKIEREEKELLSMIDADAQAHERARLERSRHLDYEFFKKKTLNKHSY